MARSAKGIRGLFVWHDLYWGGKHAAGEERERAQPGGESQECSFPAASRRTPAEETGPARPPRSGHGWLRAAPGGAAARGFRPDGAWGAGNPRPLRRACAALPSFLPTPARAAEASAAPVSAPGARRATKPGPDALEDRTTWRRGRSGGCTQRPRSGFLHPAGEAAEFAVGPGRKSIGKRAKPRLRLPGPEDG
ncbi:hypothetical protein HispidOSU_005100 [Sigmodon hispidus]